jgi:Amt family ammonium transporter
MKKNLIRIAFLAVSLFLGIGTLQLTAQETAEVSVPVIDSGNTAWMIVASALVFLMTLPGLAFFYGGLVRRKNVLNILMQCLIIAAAITLLWVSIGYSLAFGSSKGAMAPLIGNFDWAFLKGISPGDVSPYFISQPVERIPHIVFILFQCMFAIITPALIVGAFAERIRFKGFFFFTILWSLLVYIPVAHWVWSADGWLFKMGALDFAGGTVVHINAGIAALVMALLIGKRRGLNGAPSTPHNIPFVVLGAGLLWFGWFGFNAGSGLAADGLAANAFLVTHVATAMAAFTWALLDWIFHRTPSTIGISTGAVAGLVAITPAAGFVGIGGALVIGVLVSVVSFYAVSIIKPRLGYDDTLDAFGVHGVGGIIGALATGIFATPTVQPAYSGWITGNPGQFLTQVVAVLATTVFSGVMTFLLFKIIDKTTGIRVEERIEEEGLDIYEHGESAYN